MDLLYEHTRGYGPRVTKNYLVRRHGSFGRIKANLKSWRFCTKDEQYNGSHIPGYNVANYLILTKKELKQKVKQIVVNDERSIRSGYQWNHCFFKKVDKWANERLKQNILSNEENSGSISHKPNDIGDIERIQNTNRNLLRKNQQSDAKVV